MLYFAYGSNLDQIDRDDWCRARGLPVMSLIPIGAAFLPDRRLAFTHRSTTRRGGVLDVPPAIGRVVPGFVFRCGEESDGAALDRKESDGHVYRRIDTIAIQPGGGESTVVTYEVEPAHREAYVAPNPAYVDVVARGYRAFDLDGGALQAAARDEAAPGLVAGLFVYGTLRGGELRFPVLARHGARLVGEGTAEGTLVDLGPHPGLIPTPAAHPVAGELYAFDDLGRVLAETDRVEGFLGFGDEASEYRRGLVNVATARSASRLAWTYFYAGDTSGLPVVAGGAWRRQDVS